MRIERLQDGELERLAAEAGPGSEPVDMLVELRRRRAKDEQVYAFRLGDSIVVGPEPNISEEILFLLARAVAKRLSG